MHRPHAFFPEAPSRPLCPGSRTSLPPGATLQGQGAGKSGARELRHRGPLGVLAGAAAAPHGLITGGLWDHVTSEQHLNEKNGRVAEPQKPHWISARPSVVPELASIACRVCEDPRWGTRLIRQAKFEDLPSQQTYLSALRERSILSDRSVRKHGSRPHSQLQTAPQAASALGSLPSFITVSPPSQKP